MIKNIALLAVLALSASSFAQDKNGKEAGF